MARLSPAKLAHFVTDPKTDSSENLCPIIFLHGLTGWKEMWGEIPQQISNATKRQAYVVDQRNHGDAEWTDDFNFDMLTVDLLHFMDTYSIEKAIIIGMSMGGTVAINLALKNPEKVEAIFIIDMTVGKYSESLIELIKSGMNRVHNLLKQIPPDTGGEQVIRTISEELQKIIPEGLGGKMREQMVDSYMGFLKRKENGRWCARANFPALINALDNPDGLMCDPEGIYTGSTTFIYGTESILDFSENESRIKQHFPKAEMVPVEGSSHNVVADCPEKLKKTLLEFLSQILTPIQLTHYVAEPEGGAVALLSPIIFLHGLAASKEMWEDIPQVVANASKRKAYVIDQRDHGDNEWTDIFSFEILVDDLLHFMDENEIQKAILIGHSMGGSIAISAALKKPDRIEALIVEDMIVGNLPPEITVALKAIICNRYECIQKIPAELDEKEAFKKLFDYMSEILQTMPEVIRNQTKNKENAYSFLKLKRNKNGEWDFPANYKAIIKFLNEAEELMVALEGIYDGPTSFIYGTSSFLPIPAYEPQIKKYFPNAELVPIEGASHNITGDCPEELAKAILDFLTKINNEKN